MGILGLEAGCNRPGVRADSRYTINEQTLSPSVPIAVSKARPRPGDARGTV